MSIKVKDTIEVDILDSGMSGEGVARVDGKVVFLPYTLKGERVRAVVSEVKKKYVNASVIKVLSPSPHRVTPACPHYYKCGGCDACHIDGEYRRDMLLGELKNNLKKIAGIDFEPTELVTAAPMRNKLSMPFGLRGGKVVLGMYRQGTHTVEPVDCMLAGQRSRDIARAIAEFAGAKGISVYDERSGKGLLRHLVIREIAGRVSAVIVVNGDGLGEAEKDLQSLLPGVDVFVSPNTRRSNVIMGDSVRLVSGAPRLPVEVLGVKAELSPLSFFQVNDAIRDRLYTAALDALTSDMLIDLYSGIGITSVLAAKKRANVYAVEVVPQAVADADETARLNGVAGTVHNICGRAEDVLPRIAGDITGECDVLVDPPRKGCDAAVVAAVAGIAPRRLVYISCNHATMCRDIRAFIDASSARYELTDCKLFDMFSGTHHAETLAILSRTDK